MSMFTKQVLSNCSRGVVPGLEGSPLLRSSQIASHSLRQLVRFQKALTRRSTLYICSSPKSLKKCTKLRIPFSALRFLPCSSPNPPVKLFSLGKLPAKTATPTNSEAIALTSSDSAHNRLETISCSSVVSFSALVSKVQTLIASTQHLVSISWHISTILSLFLKVNS